MKIKNITKKKYLEISFVILTSSIFIFMYIFFTTPSLNEAEIGGFYHQLPSFISILLIPILLIISLKLENKVVKKLIYLGMLFIFSEAVFIIFLKEYYQSFMFSGFYWLMPGFFRFLAFIFFLLAFSRIKINSNVKTPQGARTFHKVSSKEGKK
jgi:hypothetical protein